MLELPADRPRPAVQSHQGYRHSVRLDAELASDVIEPQPEKERVTPFAMVLLGAFEILLWRYDGRHRLCFLEDANGGPEAISNWSL